MPMKSSCGHRSIDTDYHGTSGLSPVLPMSKQQDKEISNWRRPLLASGIVGVSNKPFLYRFMNYFSQQSQLFLNMLLKAICFSFGVSEDTLFRTSKRKCSSLRSVIAILLELPTDSGHQIRDSSQSGVHADRL